MKRLQQVRFHFHLARLFSDDPLTWLGILALVGICTYVHFSGGAL
jgi:hypothetical protein